MLNSLNLYIIRKFFSYFFTTLFILTGIIWLTRIVKFVDFITERNMPITDFLLLTILLLPRLVEFLLPFICFIAALITINVFYQSRELFILKAAGLNKLQIIKPLAGAAALIWLVNFLLTAAGSPYAMRKIADLKTELANDLLISAVKVGEFNEVSDGITIYVESKNSQGILNNVTIQQPLEANESLVIHAKEASLIKQSGKLLLALQNGQRMLFASNGELNSVLNFTDYLTDLDFFAEEEQITTEYNKLNQIYLTELNNANFSDKYSKAELISEEIQRIIWPVFCLLLTILAVTSLLFGSFSRKGVLLQNIYASVAALIFIGGFFLLKGLIFSRIELVFVIYLYMLTLLAILLLVNLINFRKFS